MLYRSSNDAVKVAESLEQEFKGQTFKAVQCDVTDQKRVGEAFEEVLQLFKGVLNGVVAVSERAGERARPGSRLICRPYQSRSIPG